MFVRRFIRPLIIFLTCACLPCFVYAQSASTVNRKNARASVSSSESRPAAPQVVTIIHRLNGLKMFRLLLRSQEQVEAISNFDEAFDLTDDVHTNIIAGLAMDDGRTIVAWLPDADVEFGPSLIPPDAPRAPEPPSLTSGIAALAGTQKKSPWFPFRGGMFGSPDLTVIGPDGRRLAAEYIGLDGATGLSILRLAEGNLSVNKSDSADGIGEGENVRLLNPEPAENKPVTAGGLYVRMGTTLGTVLSIRRAPAGGGVARFKVKSPHLSLQNIGGVVVNEAGETIGIVDAVRGPEATILPTGLIRRAARRVLARHASVPRPWLGVKGEPVSRLSVEQIKSQGWKLDKASSLFDRHLGIMLTSIAPGSPAAGASLRAGDVILKVNNEEVFNDDDFSWMLDQAGPSSEVVFTLARPNAVTEEFVNVELSGMLDPALAFRLSPRPPSTPSLISQGIETVALKPAVAARLGATSGLLVVYVDPATAAFDAGLMPGDVIESIDGKPFQSAESFAFGSTPTHEKTRFEIVRKKKKLVVMVNPSDKKR
jgi:S1-C subfamily serine protease